MSIIGPNGAGKTTVFNLVTGLDTPDGGSVRFAGRDVTGLPAETLAGLGLARTFQHGRVFGNLSVLDNVLVGAHTRLSAVKPAWPIVGPLAELALALVRPKRVAAEEQELRAEAATNDPRRCSATGCCRGWTIRPSASPMPTAGAWRSPARWRSPLACCCSTSRPPG